MYKPLQILAFVALALGTNTALAQQQFFIVGDDPASPELYIQDGVDGFLYIEGGLTVDQGGTAAVPDIVVNGGLFIGRDASAGPGDLIAVTGTNPVRFDFMGGTSVTGTLPTVTNADKPGTVHFVANGLQTLQSSGGDFQFYSLNLDEGNSTAQNRNIAGGNVTTGSTSAVPTGISSATQGVLYLGGEWFNTFGNQVTVLNDNVASIARDASGSAAGGPQPGMNDAFQTNLVNAGMVTSTGNGRLARRMDGSSFYLFPVGDDGHNLYRPAALDAGTAGIYQMRMELNTPNPTNFGTPAPIAVNSLYFHHINGVVGAQPQVRLYGEFPEMASIDPSCTENDLILNLSIAQSEGAGFTQWTDEGNTTTTLGVNPGAGFLPYATTLTFNNHLNPIVAVSSTGEGFVLSHKPESFITSAPCGPFPIESLPLVATPVNDHIRLDWVTTSEVNASHFEIQRSLDGQNFTYMATEDAVGSPTQSTSYLKNDYDVNYNTTYFYRLKMIDMDGVFRYSNIAHAILPNTEFHIGGIYPNPTGGMLNIDVYSAEETDYSFKVYDAIGQIVMDRAEHANSGFTLMQLDMTNFAPASYQLVISEGGNTLKTVKIVKY